MKEFFISSFEKIIKVIIIIQAIVVGLSGLAVLFGGVSLIGVYNTGVSGGVFAGVIGALAVWGLGAVFIILTGGAMFLLLGIYDNTYQARQLLKSIAERS